MIKGLIATLMISMGVATSATPSFNNNESKPPLLLNDTGTTTTDFNLNLSYTQGNVQSQTDTESSSYTCTTYKHEYNGYNSAVNVQAIRYIQTTWTTDNVILLTGLSAENKYTNMLWAIQVTPYNYLSDVNTNLQIYINVQIYTTAAYEEATLNVNFNLISSTDQDWVNYIDMSNYGTPYNNNNVYNELTSTENGYVYNSKTQQYQLELTQEETTAQTISYQEEIEIVYEETNYIYVYIEPQWNIQTSRIQSIAIDNDSPRQWTYSERPTISGTMIIPPSSVEVVDIPGLCFEILTMPFAFISQAFNLTLFPGTPYQLNLSNLFLSIIGVLVFIFIIKLLVKSKFGG